MQHNINLFYAYEQENKKPINRTTLISVSVLVAIVVINLALIGTFLTLNILSKNQISKLNDFFNEPQVIANKIKYDLLDWQIQSAEHDKEILENMDIYMADLSEFTTSAYQKIVGVKPATVNILSFSFVDNTININCTTRDNFPPADYTKALESTGMFESVIYKGFNADTENLIMFPIVCKLKGNV